MIELLNCSFTYKGFQTPSLQHVNVKINKGEFVVLCGESGSGKTTITRLINGLIPHYYEGIFTGTSAIDGLDISKMSLSRLSMKVGSVFQNPRSQFFNVDTTSELAFGCENINMPRSQIMERIQKASDMFHCESLLNRNIFELSGGEKQRIACASISAVHPDVFVFDEPSSNLDKESIEKLQMALLTLKNQGKTLIVSEHRLHYVLHLADRFLYLKNGNITEEWSSIENLSEEKRTKLGLRSLDIKQLFFCPNRNKNKISGTFRIENFSCAYQKRSVLNIPKLKLETGSIVGIIGKNGAGKSSFAQCLCGVKKHKGTIKLNNNKLSYDQRLKKSFMVMQDINHQLFTESVYKELTLNVDEIDHVQVTQILKALGLDHLADAHPLSLSGGQKQKVAIASAILAKKEMLIYDEPSSGLDYKSLQSVCREIQKASKAVKLSFVVTHDPELIMQCCTHIIHFANKQLSDFYPIDDKGVEKLKNYFC